MRADDQAHSVIVCSEKTRHMFRIHKLFSSFTIKLYVQVRSDDADVGLLFSKQILEYICIMKF